MLFTVGHSNHEIEVLLELLDRHGIEVLADVRSQPWSKHNPQFRRPALQRAVQRAGKRYVWLGEQLGGMPEDPALRDEDGNVDYALVAGSYAFKAGLHRLLDGISRFRVAMMCAEEDPAGCHRHHLVCKALGDRAVVRHIRKDGSLEDDASVAQRSGRAQGRLFDA